MAKKTGRKNKKKTLGVITQTRATWHISPLTKVVSNGKKKGKNERKSIKEKLKRGDYDV